MRNVSTRGYFTKHPIQTGKGMIRNEKCYCGSGKKYKKCHMMFDTNWGQDDQLRWKTGERLQSEAAVANVQTMFGDISKGQVVRR